MSSLDPVAAAPVGVFAYVRRDGTPNAVPVTPFVVGGNVVVTSTLAYVAKAAAVRRDPRVALLAGGVHLATTATVTVDPTPAWFNTHIRADEINKFPPTRQFLQIPFHECLFPWYSARVIIELAPADPVPVVGADRATVTSLDPSGRPRITPVTGDVDPGAERIRLEGTADGPAMVLVHEESDDMAELRQLSLLVTVRDGHLTVTARHGTLVPRPATARTQVATVRSMARQARTNRPLIAGWPRARVS